MSKRAACCEIAWRREKRRRMASARRASVMMENVDDEMHAEMSRE